MSSESPDRIRVAVVGAAGRMGSLACATVSAHEDMELVAQVGRGESLEACSDADVIVEFAGAEGSRSALDWALGHDTSLIIGSSGLTVDEVRAVIEQQSAELESSAVLVIPNFSIGALLIRHFAASAAPHFESVAIVEYANVKKKDAPSGTAVETAKQISSVLDQERSSNPAENQLGEVAAAPGVPIASVRLPHLLSGQEVLLGSSSGESLTLGFNTMDRSAYMVGLVAAIRKSQSTCGVLAGLESVTSV